MCFVSFVSDGYGTGDRWPKPVPYIPQVPAPIIPWETGGGTQLPWDREALDLFKQILAELKKLDEKLGLKDCEDPNKQKFIKELEEKVKAQEQTPPAPKKSLGKRPVKKKKTE